MLKKYLLGTSLLVSMAFSFTSCSSDDSDDAKDCDSCTAQGQNIEICDNGNGTYTLTAAGESDTVTEEDLGGLPPAQFIQLICELANITP